MNQKPIEPQIGSTSITVAKKKFDIFVCLVEWPFFLFKLGKGFPSTNCKVGKYYEGKGWGIIDLKTPLLFTAIDGVEWDENYQFDFDKAKKALTEEERVSFLKMSTEEQEMTICRGLYKKRKLEPAILLLLSLVPNNKYVSNKYISTEFGVYKWFNRNDFQLMNSVFGLVKKGLLEKFSLLDYKKQHSQTEFVKFVKDNIYGSVIIVGSGQTQSVFRITEEGKNKLKFYRANNFNLKLEND